MPWLWAGRPPSPSRLPECVRLGGGRVPRAEASLPHRPWPVWGRTHGRDRGIRDVWVAGAKAARGVRSMRRGHASRAL